MNEFIPDPTARQKILDAMTRRTAEQSPDFPMPPPGGVVAPPTSAATPNFGAPGLSADPRRMWALSSPEAPKLQAATSARFELDPLKMWTAPAQPLPPRAPEMPDDPVMNTGVQPWHGGNPQPIEAPISNPLGNANYTAGSTGPRERFHPRQIGQTARDTAWSMYGRSFTGTSQAGAMPSLSTNFDPSYQRKPNAVSARWRFEF